MLEITNADEVPIMRRTNAPLVFRWDGSQYREGDVAVFREFPNRLACTVDARSGEFRLPASIRTLPSFELRFAVRIERHPNRPLLFSLQTTQGRSIPGLAAIYVQRGYYWF